MNQDLRSFVREFEGAYPGEVIRVPEPVEDRRAQDRPPGVHWFSGHPGT